MPNILATAGFDELRSNIGDLETARRYLFDARLEGEGQEQVRVAILNFCDANGDALSRECAPGHLTGSAVVVNNAGDQVLLIHHKKLHRWLQPGGHADGEGDLALVALKEASEETGIEGLRVVTTAIDLDIHEIPARGDDPAHFHHDVRFVVLAPADAVLKPNHETNGAKWIDPVRDADALESAELRRLVQNGLRVAAAYRAI